LPAGGSELGLKHGSHLDFNKSAKDVQGYVIGPDGGLTTAHLIQVQSVKYFASWCLTRIPKTSPLINADPHRYFPPPALTNDLLPHR
jgi:hypothetical protein